MVFCRSGKCGLFGEGGLIMFDVNSAKPTYSIPDLLAVIFLGVIGGIFGSLYNYLVDKVLRTYSIINEYALEIPFIFISIPMGYICLSTIFDITHNTTTCVCNTIYVYIT